MTQSVRYAWKSLRWGYPWLDWSVCVDFINLAYLPGLLTIPVDVRFISMMDLGSRIGSTMPPPGSPLQFNTATHSSLIDCGE